MIGATTPNIYARHLSDTQRYNDGYSNGAQGSRQQILPITRLVIQIVSIQATVNIRRPIAAVGLMVHSKLGTLTMEYSEYASDLQVVLYILNQV